MNNECRDGLRSSVNSDGRDEKIITLLHFAKKANKLVLGHDAVVRSLKQKKIRLVITAIDYSQNSLNSFSHQTKNSSVETISWGTKTIFSNIFGKETGIIGIIDEQFKSGIKKHFSETKLEA